MGSAYLLIGLSGCGRSSDSRPADDTPAIPSPSASVPKELLGVWTHASGKGTRYYPKMRLTFNERGIVTLGDASHNDEWIANYRAEPNRLIFSDKYGNTLRYDIGQLSDSELLLGSHVLHYVGGLSVLQGAYTFLEGRWRHESDTPDGAVALGTGPVADANRLVRKVEALLAKNEAKQKAAVAERDGWAAKLRAVGVHTPADLKGNARGRVIAENMVTLANEIEGRDRQLADLDAALLKANSLVRRLESEEATLTDAERRALAGQLKDVDERTDRVPLPVTPLDVEAAVEKALKATTPSKKSK
jgi:hypothetical protein